MIDWQLLQGKIKENSFLHLAKCISYVENEAEGCQAFLQNLEIGNTPVIGITGPPGAGKSTLTDALIGQLVANNRSVAVLCVDPSSPFNLGALLGDRIRMSEWYNNDKVYIRSLATRGALGGLHPSIIEITDVLKSAAFDYIIVETVGVGQSEIEIAGLADVTCVVLVPEAGDEVQTMKAGLMEIANIFVVNKADRPEADLFVNNLKKMLAPVYSNHAWQVPVVKTSAVNKEGIADLIQQIETYQKEALPNEKKLWLLTQKAYALIQQHRMKDISKQSLKEFIAKSQHQNIYQLIKKYNERKTP